MKHRTPFPLTIRDRQTTQVGLPERIEDARGREAWRAEDIDPYGLIRVAEGNTVEYDLRWPGHWFERETGLHCNRFRVYCPRLGRYLQSDPMGLAGGINLYGYPANPLAAVDVLGLKDAHKATEGNNEAPYGSGVASEGMDLTSHASLRHASWSERLAAQAHSAWEVMKAGLAKREEERARGESGPTYVTLEGGQQLQIGSNMGPCLSVVMDITTGRVFYGQNPDYGENTKRKPSDYYYHKLSELADLKIRIVKSEPEDGQLDFIVTKKEPDIEPRPIRSVGTAGTHSEVHAICAALQARPEAKLSELAVYNIRTKATTDEPAGEPMPRCGNCLELTRGVIALTD
ncbi:RHS repeat-associated core domain-containing protein [Pseudomonas chlororaphis]|uniref:RHS repeat-associated core domain-containing protein n=1 Tax=Pseudomonas chlororaphis TaxID=587753 RepID=UPI000F589C5E|nr:RHS repeat-associated core domain-containing protein [Pseudomonas chlororaphis]